MKSLLCFFILYSEVLSQLKQFINNGSENKINKYKAEWQRMYNANKWIVESILYKEGEEWEMSNLMILSQVYSW